MQKRRRIPLPDVRHGPRQVKVACMADHCRWVSKPVAVEPDRPPSRQREEAIMLLQREWALHCEEDHPE